MTIIVTGGAGYIGAHVVEALAAAGREVVVVDDLTTSSAHRVGDHALHELDLAAPGSTEVLTQIMGDLRATGVVHLAAKKQVGESVARPEWYYRQNVGGLGTVLEAARATACDRLVFSSSAAVYGEPAGGVVTENTAPAPINPYGETKLVGEWMIRSAARAWGLRQVALRYFNVAGAGRPELGDPAVLNLVTLVLDRLERGEAPLVFGDDYPTPDGTCVRDYIHVADLAAAHVAALDYLDRPAPAYDTFDVGTGRGVSVAEMLAAIGSVSGSTIEPQVVDRRQGDPATLIATAGRIRSELQWEPRLGLEEIVASAWTAWRVQRDAGLDIVAAAR